MQKNIHIKLQNIKYDSLYCPTNTASSASSPDGQYTRSNGGGSGFSVGGGGFMPAATEYTAGRHIARDS